MICWHKFTSWSDILVFCYTGQSYLLQGRKCSKCKKTKFRIQRAVRPLFAFAECGTLTEKKLQIAGLWEPESDGE